LWDTPSRGKVTRNRTNSCHSINKAKDFVGLKIRVITNPINLDWARVLGANPTPMVFPEVYAVLESKALDGQENSLSVISANKMYEVQQYLTITNHV
jgi:TRAP-type C4-dicarboxylate transport system substrate-binding protein